MKLLQDKRCQSLLSQEEKNCKIKDIDLFIEKFFVSFVNLFSNRISYCIFQVIFQIYGIFDSLL